MVGGVQVGTYTMPFVCKAYVFINDGVGVVGLRQQREQRWTHHANAAEGEVRGERREVRGVDTL